MEIKFKTSTLLIGAGVLAAVILLIIPFRNASQKKKEAQIESAIVIEKIEKVLKVVTVEGHYSELINYEQATFDFPGFRKKAVVQVNGRILMGYNLDQLKADADVKKKILRINNISQPQVIAVEADARFFDLQQGIFNSFTKQELTQIDQKAKETIRNKAVTDGLVKRAEEQKYSLIEALCWPLIADGWVIEVDGKPMNIAEIKEKKD